MVEKGEGKMEKELGQWGFVFVSQLETKDDVWTGEREVEEDEGKNKNKSYYFPISLNLISRCNYGDLFTRNLSYTV